MEKFNFCAVHVQNTVIMVILNIFNKLICFFDDNLGPKHIDKYITISQNYFSIEETFACSDNKTKNDFLRTPTYSF